MAKQTSSKSSASPAKRKRTSEAPAPITKTILKADAVQAEPVTAAQPASVSVQRDVAIKPEPSHDQIAQRAFELYQGRSVHDGDQESDWLRAEQQLRS
jgi:hypothetical protein